MGVEGVYVRPLMARRLEDTMPEIHTGMKATLYGCVKTLVARNGLAGTRWKKCERRHETRRGAWILRRCPECQGEATYTHKLIDIQEDRT